MIGPMRSAITLFVCAAVIGGCGSTRTVTVTETVTETVQASVSDTGDPAAFCDSAAGDKLAQADSASNDAFNAGDTEAMLDAEKQIYTQAKKAPPGAQCAIDALESLRFAWNNGSANFAGIDVAAKAKTVRKFQDKHQLGRTDTAY